MQLIHSTRLLLWSIINYKFICLGWICDIYGHSFYCMCMCVCSCVCVFYIPYTFVYRSTSAERVTQHCVVKDLSLSLCVYYKEQTCLILLYYLWTMDMWLYRITVTTITRLHGTNRITFLSHSNRQVHTSGSL